MSGERERGAPRPFPLTPGEFLEAAAALVLLVVVSAAAGFTAWSLMP